MTKPRDLSKLGGGFIQSGTGAVQRSVESKLKDVVQLTDFMTQAQINDANNNTRLYDHTAAVQAFVDYVVSNQLTGHFNCRAIHITAPIEMNNSGYFPPGSGKAYHFFGDGPTGTTISEWVPASHPAGSGTRPYPVARLFDFSDQAGPSVIFEKIGFNGPEGLATGVFGGTGVYLHNSNGIVFRDVWARGLTKGFEKDNTCSYIVLDYCTAEYCQTGIDFADGVQCFITNITTYENLTDIELSGFCHTLVVDNITLFNSVYSGISMTDASYASISNVLAWQNYLTYAHNSKAIVLNGSCTNNRIRDVMVFDTGVSAVELATGGTSTNNMFDGIYVRGGTNYTPIGILARAGNTGNLFTNFNLENTGYGIVDQAGDNNYSNGRLFNNSLAGILLGAATEFSFSNISNKSNTANWSISGGPTVWLRDVDTTLDAGFTPARYGAKGAGNSGRIFYGTAAPVSGTYAVGDRVSNTSPAVGQPKGWLCTVAGTPGTWVSEGNL